MVTIALKNSLPSFILLLPLDSGDTIKIKTKRAIKKTYNIALAGLFFSCLK